MTAWPMRVCSLHVAWPGAMCRLEKNERLEQTRMNAFVGYMRQHAETRRRNRIQKAKEGRKAADVQRTAERNSERFAETYVTASKVEQKNALLNESLAWNADTFDLRDVVFEMGDKVWTSKREHVHDCDSNKDAWYAAYLHLKLESGVKISVRVKTWFSNKTGVYYFHYADEPKVVRKVSSAASQYAFLRSSYLRMLVNHYVKKDGASVKGPAFAYSVSTKNMLFDTFDMIGLDRATSWTWKKVEILPSTKTHKRYAALLSVDKKMEHSVPYKFSYGFYLSDLPVEIHQAKSDPRDLRLVYAKTRSREVNVCHWRIKDLVGNLPG